ncbi:MAG: RNA polymerase sigma factor [Candidatus Aminicenantes bacterium]|nr:RNA polymerase sigma factor [Candidatus Aminicenantes bacterium]
MLSDDEVIQSVQNGHIQDFEVIVNRYEKLILNFIYKMISDYEEAQNITQDVFLKVFKTLNRYQRKDNFQAYIFTIAKNLTLNDIKKRKRVVFLSTLLRGNRADDYFRHDEDFQGHLEKEMREHQLTSAIKSLNENQRIALILKVYLRFSYKRIAEITGWSTPKIETLISRAKSQLKNKIFLQEKGIQNVKKVRKK